MYIILVCLFRIIRFNFNISASLVCLYCTDAVAPADCGTVIRCGSHEVSLIDIIFFIQHNLCKILGNKSPVETGDYICNSLILYLW
jgi:hypothetical protein